VEVSLKAVIAGLMQLVGDSSQVPVNPLVILLWDIDRFASSNALFILPGNGILSIGSMESQLIMVEDVLLAGASIWVNGQ